jgi:hypothetical protein
LDCCAFKDDYDVRRRSRKQEQEQGSGRQGHNLAGASPVVSNLSVSDT